eukprot:5292548-Pyramimonas_sp.AAC.1
MSASNICASRQGEASFVSAGERFVQGGAEVAGDQRRRAAWTTSGGAAMQEIHGRICAAERLARRAQGRCLI